MCENKYLIRIQYNYSKVMHICSPKDILWSTYISCDPLYVHVCMYIVVLYMLTYTMIKCCFDGCEKFFHREETLTIHNEFLQTEQSSMYHTQLRKSDKLHHTRRDIFLTTTWFAIATEAYQSSLL